MRSASYPSARIMLSDDQDPINCVLREDGENSAVLVVMPTLCVPESFTLIADNRPPRRARVAWRTLTEVGVNCDVEESLEAV